MTKKYILSIGLFDKDSKKQEVKTEDAQRLVNNAVAQRFDGATVYSADGVYKHNDGTTVREPTIRIELLYTTREAVVELATWAKEALNQESVLMETIEVEADFI
jgi:hypothetical protein